jgi:ubiquinone/menaquinone biosynthesis C-methylase UbiE
MDENAGTSSREHIGAVARALGAEGYERSRIQRYIARVHDAMLDALASQADAPGRILDVGCGTGRLLRKLGERWPSSQLLGVDPNEGMVSVARRLTPLASLHVGTAESIPIDSASIDLVVTSISFHHWADQPRALREVFRVLRPGGCLCLADITLPRWVARLVRSGARSPNSLKSLIAQAGLELQQQRLVLARVIVLAVATRPKPAA